MEEKSHLDLERSSARSWAILIGIAIAFLIWGFTLFFFIGDKGVPEWDYSIVEDIPGESPYSSRSTKSFSGPIPTPRLKDEMSEQHVMEPARRVETPKSNQGRQ